jgi:hypothetical protein
LLVPVFAGNQAAHDLPERVFGRSSAQDPVGPGELADVGGDVFADLMLDLVGPSSRHRFPTIRRYPSSSRMVA